MICVECREPASDHGTTKTLCIHCNRRIDRYAQTSDTHRYVDCLLLKDQVFRHYLLNTEITPSRYLKVSLLQLVSMMVLQVPTGIPKSGSALGLHFTELKVQLLITPLYILLLGTAFRSVGWYKITFIVLFSSFFSYFRIVFVLWEYRDPQYHAVLELLNCCANITALKCFDSHRLKVLLFVLLSRAICLFVVLELRNDLTNLEFFVCSHKN